MTATTPAMRTVCATRSGDYYEFTGTDAVVVARALGLTLQSQLCTDGTRTHYTAFAAHMAARCVERLREDGWLCDEVAE